MASSLLRAALKDLMWFVWTACFYDRKWLLSLRKPVALWYCRRPLCSPSGRGFIRPASTRWPLTERFNLGVLMRCRHDTPGGWLAHILGETSSRPANTGQNRSCWVSKRGTAAETKSFEWVKGNARIENSGKRADAAGFLRGLNGRTAIEIIPEDSWIIALERHVPVALKLKTFLRRPYLGLFSDPFSSALRQMIKPVGLVKVASIANEFG